MGTFGINGCDGSIWLVHLAKGCLWGLESWVGRKRGQVKGLRSLHMGFPDFILKKKIVIGSFIFFNIYLLVCITS